MIDLSQGAGQKGFPTTTFRFKGRWRFFPKVYKPTIHNGMELVLYGVHFARHASGEHRRMKPTYDAIVCHLLGNYAGVVCVQQHT